MLAPRGTRRSSRVVRSVLEEGDPAWSGDFEDDDDTFVPFPANLPTVEEGALSDSDLVRTNRRDEESTNTTAEAGAIADSERVHMHQWEEESTSERLKAELLRFLGDVKGPIVEPYQRKLQEGWDLKADRDFHRPWWSTLEKVFILEYSKIKVGHQEAGPIGVYVNRTELDGVWSDIIVSWQRREDAERHMTLLEADVDDPSLVLQVIEMEPLRLAVIALETDSLCDVQRSGSLLTPPERNVGSVEDIRSSLERSFGTLPGSETTP